MPWTPTAQEMLSLKSQIKRKFPLSTDDGIDLLPDHLLEAKGKNQAEAVLNAATEFTDIGKLREYGFGKLANNSPATIKAALKPDALQAAAHQRHQTDLQNRRVNDYLSTVNCRAFHEYRHQNVAPVLPLEDYVGGQRSVIARRYHNNERKLPRAAHYIEWYPLTRGQRSPHKRFFTA